MPPLTIDDARKMLKDVRKDLHGKANVIATGIGYKKKNGEQTHYPSIMCSVEQKQPMSALDPKDVIPPKYDIIPTDVIETGVLRALSNTEKQRPAQGGDSIGHYAVTAGTLGCVVSRDGQKMILSNNHVIANSNNASFGDPILQPGSHDGGRDTEDRIALLNDFIRIDFQDGGLPTTDCPIAGGISGLLNILAALLGRKSRVKPYSVEEARNLVDAALAKPLDQNLVDDMIREIGYVTHTAEAELEMKVQKNGRTTGYTTGIVQQIDVTSQVSYGTNKVAVFEDQIIIENPADGKKFSEGGDSGSAVLSMTNGLVGLLFAGSDTVTVVNRIDNVFSALGCDLYRTN